MDFFTGVSGGKLEVFAVQYFGEEYYNRIKYEAVCQVKYSKGEIEGSISKGVSSLHDVNVVTRVECD